MATEKKYTSLKDFYPYYLTEHSDPICRELHFTGTLGFFLLLFSAFIFQKWWLLFCYQFVAMVLHGQAISFLKKIDLLLFNIHFIVWLQILLCFTTY